jgi:hypothetical protein
MLQVVGSNTHYEPEVSGGRTRPDGVEIKWDVLTPACRVEKKGTSLLSFFCVDIAPLKSRVCRVPHLQVPKTPHRTHLPATL